MFQKYGETTPTDFKKMYPWSTMLVSVSQIYALYCLVHFYYGTKAILQPVRPLTKFVSVKLIVFATFWQSFALCVVVVAPAPRPRDADPCSPVGPPHPRHMHERLTHAPTPPGPSSPRSIASTTTAAS